MEKTTITAEDIQEYVRKAAAATGTQAAWLIKAFRPAKNAIIHSEQLELWQTLHDSLDRVATLRKYARRMEQYGNALIGYARAFDVEGNPIPYESRADDILIWTKSLGKFDLARHAKEELAYLRKHPRNVSFINFRVGKEDKTGVEAKREALANEANNLGKKIKSIASKLEKLDSGEITARLVVDVMFALEKVPPSIRTPYVSHMINAHLAAIGADLANQIAASRARQVADAPSTDKAGDKPSKGKGKDKGKGKGNK